MPVCAVAITRSPIVQCPATPTWPARITSLPTAVDPASPTCAHNSVLVPTDDPCPTCTRLSIFEPRPTRVCPHLHRPRRPLPGPLQSLSPTPVPDARSLVIPPP